MKIKEYYNKIENKNLKSDLIKIIGIFGLKTENSKRAEIVYNKNDGPTMRELARKYGLPMDNTQHQDIFIPIVLNGKDFVLNIRQTGAKVGSVSGVSGKQKSDLTEKGTLASVYLPLEEVQDLFFKGSAELYTEWKDTFAKTAIAIKSILKDPNKFVCIHDATGEIFKGKSFVNGGSKFTNLISKIGRYEFSSKDAYCPADAWFIAKDSYNEILSILADIAQDKESAVDRCNALILKMYEDKVLYPISLKKVEGSKAKIEIHKEKVIPVYEVTPVNIDLNLEPNSAMLGAYKYKNEGESGLIRFKMRASQLGYVMAQTEFESDGSAGSGKAAMVGKCPTIIIDKIMKEYGYSRITSISYFGGSKKGPYFTNITDKEIKEWYEMYSFCKAKSYVNDKAPKKLEDLKELVNKAKGGNSDIAAKLCVKIQGLYLLYFLCKEDKNISDIISRMLNAAKKISNKNAFFIKIW